jgi:hypothetical protein
MESGINGGKAFQVEIVSKQKCVIGQLDIKDSRYHSDCLDLPKLLFKLLGHGWIDSSLAEKEIAGRLWIPCLRKEEIEQLFRSAPLAKIREDIWKAIRYWDDVRIVQPDSGSLPFPEGEVFFETDEWRLSEIDFK